MITTNQEMEVIVSDLTYVKVGQKWYYICFFINLFNKEIIGMSTGKKKSSSLVLSILSTINYWLNNVTMLHTEFEKEFDNQYIEDALTDFGIERSLSLKGCLYDNTIAEATFKAVKTEFIYQNHFRTLSELELKFCDYINWHNHHRIHDSLNYQSPIHFKLSTT